MTEKKTSKKRIGAFLFFDKNGIVGDYIEYLLKKMSEHTDRIVMVCNGFIGEEGRCKVNKYVSDIFIRENRNYDAGGWKDLFLNFISWEELEEYDEMLMFNDSFFGPVYPLDELFVKMDNMKDLDFWGITMHGKKADPYGICKYGYFPAHIQSYFIGVRKNMLLSDDFRTYWEEMPATDNLKEAISNFEVTFTRTFEEMGYKWDVYVDTSEYLTEETENINLSFFRADELMIEKRNPFPKRKALYERVNHRLSKSDGYEPKRCIEYIDRNTNYPVDLIWKQLLRTVNIREIYEAYHFDFILPDESVQNSIPDDITLVLRINRPEQFSLYWKYLECISDKVDILIVSTETEKMQSILKQTDCERMKLIESFPRNLCEYKYACYIDDEDMDVNKYSLDGKTYLHSVFESMLHSGTYVTNVVSTFEQNKQLGVLCTADHYFGQNVLSFCDAWKDMEMYDVVSCITEELNLHCNINKRQAPVSTVNGFWFRTEALISLMDLWREHWNKNYIATVAVYYAQNAGFYSGVVYPIEQASVILSNTTNMFRQIVNESMKYDLKEVWSFATLIDSIYKKRNTYKKENKELQKLRKYKSKKQIIKEAVKVCIKQPIPKSLRKKIRGKSI